MRQLLLVEGLYNPGNGQQPPRIAVVTRDNTPENSPGRGGDKKDKDGSGGGGGGGENDEADKGAPGGGSSGSGTAVAQS